MGGAPTFCSRVISWHWLMGEIQGVSREHINRAEPASCTRAPLGQSRLRYIKAKKKKNTQQRGFVCRNISAWAYRGDKLQ